MTRRHAALIVSWVAYAAAVLLANWMTSTFGTWEVGFGLAATAGTFAAGFALVARDFVHRYGGPITALGAVIGGIAASYVLADPRIATASAIAFGTAELLDLGVFGATIRRLGFIRAVVVSNLLSAPVDTVVFLAVAGFPMAAADMGGQLVGKIAWATLIPLAVYVTLRPREATAER